jgi:endogenous inhibitor of DNA gyrase (YacG/DUF329 family)
MTRATERHCPTCRGESIKDGNKLWPFCSTRCHLVDLGRWLGEEYRVADQADTSASPGDPDKDPA